MLRRIHPRACVERRRAIDHVVREELGVVGRAGKCAGDVAVIPSRLARRCILFANMMCSRSIACLVSLVIGSDLFISTCCHSTTACDAAMPHEAPTCATTWSPKMVHCGRSEGASIRGELGSLALVLAAVTWPVVVVVDEHLTRLGRYGHRHSRLHWQIGHCAVRSVHRERRRQLFGGPVHSGIPGSLCRRPIPR